MGDFDADVLVVGAGPTGLALANALARLGSSAMVVEAKDATSVHTKATNLMPGTLEQLAVLGLTDRMYASGGVMTRYMVHMYGANVGPRPMHLAESPHPNVLFLGQDLIDRNLADALREAGVEVRFSHRLAGLSQDGDGVTATIEAGGREERLRFRYVVGCDGPRSVTRRGTACDFEPVRTGKYVWQADARLTWRSLKTMRQMWLYYYNEGFGAVIHLPGGLTKVMVFEEKGRIGERPPTLAEIQDRLRMMSGDPTATLTDPVWLSHGELLTGVAPTLIDGRIILAGDACNPILPNGGQGLNIGIQDGLNLAWKLHDVLKGYASPRLLATYDAERRAVRLALEKVQISTLRYTLPAPRLNRFVLRRFGNALLNRFWPAMAKAFSQLGLTYAKSPLTRDLLGGKGVRAGHRVLDADVVRACDGAEVSLFGELCAPQWKILSFDDGERLPGTALPHRERFPWARTLRVSARTADADPAEADYLDVERMAHKAYGVAKPTILLVRPDNYVAARLPGDRPGEVERYFGEWYPGA